MGGEQEEEGESEGGEKGPGQEDDGGGPQRAHVCSSRYDGTFLDV